ncbi:MAG: hypothetical protein KIT39_13550 [Nitrospirales bacterium]|nr:hypothetical protein [Nitrospirales bacterium]
MQTMSPGVPEIPTGCIPNHVQRPVSLSILLRGCRRFVLDPPAHDRGILLIEDRRIPAGSCSLIEHSGTGTQQILEPVANRAVCWVRPLRAVVRPVAIWGATHPVTAGTI